LGPGPRSKLDKIFHLTRPSSRTTTKKIPQRLEKTQQLIGPRQLKEGGERKCGKPDGSSPSGSGCVLNVFVAGRILLEKKLQFFFFFFALSLAKLHFLFSLQIWVLIHNTSFSS
jgi:hypothetical protein